ncbi:MAG: hypothetical protein HZC28_18655 [Spirochaetes bacterium]|nr:hypothetical protein [Spirochaetota bacterium]
MPIRHLIALCILFTGIVYAQMKTPAMTTGNPAPGSRVKVIVPEYAGTDVHHTLYLPPEWKPNGTYPVMIEYTGNYFPASGSTGKVEDANLGYGLTAGKGFIWAVLPFIETNHRGNAVKWWGDENATAAYCLREVKRICAEYGGDPKNVFICGFSRGAIAVNYIGLRDDTIASLWRGFITHDHYDGEQEWKGTSWGAPFETYQKKARERLHRLKGRPVLVMRNGSTGTIQRFIGDMTNTAPYTFLDVPIKDIFPVIPNDIIMHPHTDKWLSVPSEAKSRVDAWLTHAMNK